MKIFRNVLLSMGVAVFAASLALFSAGNQVNAEVKKSEQEPNDSPQTANTIEMGSKYEGTCGSADHDYFKLVLDKDSVIRFSPGSSDHKYVLYDSNNVYITEYDRLDAFTYKFEKGTYFLEVSYDPFYGLGEKYTIQFSCYADGLDEPFSDFNDDKEGATDIELGKTYKAQLAVNDLKDWYKFTFDKEDDLNISFDSNFTFDVCLQRENGEIASEMTVKGDFNKKIKLSAGTYYLLFNDWDPKEGGTYSFTLHYYTVSVQIEGKGKVDVTPQSGTYGTKVSLLASLTDGYIFKGYELVSGDVTDFNTFNLGADFTLGKSNVVIKAVFVSDKANPSDPTSAPTAKPTTAPSSSLSFDSDSYSVVCGNTLGLKAKLKSSSDNISWKSSNTKIATVDSSGKVTSKQAGTVTITATVAGKSATCTVTVLYKDVTSTKDFWFAPTNYLTSANVVKGYDKQTKFKPANDCTRAQMVTFLWRLAGEPAPKSTSTNFKDIKSKDYFYKPVLWAVEKGITTGVSKTKFNPKGVCTRAQTVTFLWRMAEKPEPNTTKNKFSDVKTKDYFYKAVLWASEKKIVAGYSDGTFKPQGKCLRRQMVTFLYKYDKFINGKG